MNTASEWRLKMAREFGHAYDTVPQVRAVLLAGSVAGRL